MLSVDRPVWDDGRWVPLPALDGEHEADVCVVGLGGSGLACVSALVGDGARVIGLDAACVGGCAAGRNGGFLIAGLAAFHHDAARLFGRERAASLYRLTLDEIDRIVTETPSVVRRVGTVRVASSAEEAIDCERQLESMRADGLPVERYEGPEGRGLLFPRDAAFDPLGRCRLLAGRALEAGARLHESSPAIVVSGAEVCTPRGRVRCRAVVVAVDGNLERVLPELGGIVRTARLQMLATAPTDEIAVPRPVYARWGLDYWQQLPDGRVALGGFRDRGGEAEWTGDATPTDDVQLHLERFLRDGLGVRAPVTHRWASAVSFSPDGLPLVAEVRPGVWAVGAYCGTGNVLGALCGRAAAARVAGGNAPLLPLIDRRPNALLPLHV